MFDEEELNGFREFINPDKNKDTFKKDSNVQAIKFSSYNVPKFTEKPFKDWVNCGADNLYPNYLVDKINKCGIHNAIVESKVKQIVGEGWMVQDSEDKDQLGEITEFLKKIDANKLLRRIAFDYELFGYFFLGVTWSNDRTKIANIFHVDASSVRVGVPIKQEDGFTRETEYFYYSEDWSKYRKKEFCPDELPIFDPSVRISPTSIQMIRGYRPNTRFYNLPGYIGAINSIELSYEISNYMLNSTKNGLSPSLLFSFNNGNPSDEEKSVVYNSIKQLYGGSENAGKFIMSFSNGKDNATTITPIQTSNLSEMLAGLAEYVTNDIVRSHRVPNPVLVGIAVPGQMGMTNEVSESSELFTNEVIYPVQLLIEETLQELLEINGFTLKVSIKDSRPISFTYEDNTLMGILTVSEMRERIGMPPLSEADYAKLAVNVKTEGGGADGAKAPKPANPKAVTAEEKTEQGMEDEKTEQMKTNEVLRKLSGREFQGLMRVINQYKKKKISRELASSYLQQTYGLSQETAEVYLGSDSVEEEQMSEEPINSIEDLRKYVIGNETKLATNTGTMIPYVDQTKKKKITSPDKLI